MRLPCRGACPCRPSLSPAFAIWGHPAGERVVLLRAGDDELDSRSERSVVPHAHCQFPRALAVILSNLWQFIRIVADYVGEELGELLDHVLFAQPTEDHSPANCIDRVNEREHFLRFWGSGMYFSFLISEAEVSRLGTPDMPSSCRAHGFTCFDCVCRLTGSLASMV